MSMKKLFFIFLSFCLFLPFSSLAEKAKDTAYQPVINLSGTYNKEDIYILLLKDLSLDSSNVDNFDMYKFAGLTKLGEFLLITVDAEKIGSSGDFDHNVYQSMYQSMPLCLFVSGSIDELEQTKDFEHYTFALPTIPPSSFVRRPGPYSLPFNPELASLQNKITSDSLPFPVFEHLVGDSDFKVPFNNTQSLNARYEDLNPFFSHCP